MDKLHTFIYRNDVDVSVCAFIVCARTTCIYSTAIFSLHYFFFKARSRQLALVYHTYIQKHPQCTYLWFGRTKMAGMILDYYCIETFCKGAMACVWVLKSEQMQKKAPHIIIIISCLSLLLLLFLLQTAFK